MKRGFTLVELSIVLVIVGLLIGGILAAQSMIATAKIQSVIRQISQFDVAVQNFQTKYAVLPGDATLFGGNGNDWIQDANDSSTEFSGEIGRFWNNLSLTGLKSEFGTVYTDASTLTNISLGRNVPIAALNSKAGVIAMGGEPGISAKQYWIAAFLGSSLAVYAVFTPAEVLAIDSKLDDGKANDYNGPPTAYVRGMDGAGGSGNGCYDGNDVYNTSNRNRDCFLGIRMGITTGTQSDDGSL